MDGQSDKAIKQPSEIHSPTPTEPLLTVEEVAQYLRLEPDTVRKLAREGKFPAVKVGRVWRFRRSTIKAWIKEQESAA